MDLRSAKTYQEWISTAKSMDEYLGLDAWKESDSFAYYDYNTIWRILRDIRNLRKSIEEDIKDEDSGTAKSRPAEATDSKTVRPLPKAEELRRLLEACVKSNFGGTESPRLYSQTYYGTKILLQEFIDEGLLQPLVMHQHWVLIRE